MKVAGLNFDDGFSDGCAAGTVQHEASEEGKVLLEGEGAITGMAPG